MPPYETPSFLPYASLSEEQRAKVDSWNLNDRYEAVQQGWGLDVLVGDPFMCIRRAVAEQGYGLETLLYDRDANVRSRIARMGYGLETLVDDPASLVRYSVVRQRYGLDKLAHDLDESIRHAVSVTLGEDGLDLEDWTRQNPDRCALPEHKRASLDSEARDMQAACGYASRLWGTGHAPGENGRPGILPMKNLHGKER